MMFLIGSISKIIFKSSDDYLVGLFRVKESSNEEYSKGTVSITGYFHDVLEGENIKIFGNMVIHPKYGEQFSCEYFEKIIPDEKDSLIDFFTSGMFKGIGEKTAEKIVKKLGSDAVRIILNDPSELDKVSGLTKKIKENLYSQLLEYSFSYNIILRLNQLGFSSKESSYIYKEFKMDTERVIEENLYDLLDLEQLNFKKVDRIALLNNYSENDPRRIERGILQVLFEYTNALGNSYLEKEEIYRYTVNLLRTHLEEEEYLNSLNKLITNMSIIRKEEKYFLRYMYVAEDNIVDRVLYLLDKKKKTTKKIKENIEILEKESNLKYNREQKQAIEKSVDSNFLIITGGPGTGKTTIVKSIINMYKKINELSYDELFEEVILLAPTGRASKRLSEKSLYPASTIHSFLKWNKETDRFMVNEYNRSDAKLLIIDEASMLDFLLFDNLLKGVKANCRIIMVGDYNQLPSVGPGQLLKDLIESEKIEVVSLTKLYRQEEDSSIIDFAHNLNNGILDLDIFNKKEDLYFIESEDTAEKIVNICKSLKLDIEDDFQVLAPMYKGINGIDRLNNKLQELLNPKERGKKEITIGDHIYRENDKVLQLVNIPDEKIFNGDIGFISEINNKNITIQFDTNEIIYTPANYNNFTLGYAISIHKSQGSEFDTVIVPVVSSFGRMLYRKLYYTAVTRSKKKLYVVGDALSLKKALENNIQDIRKTNIKEKMLNTLDK